MFPMSCDITKVPERGVEPLCPFGQTGLSRPRIPFRHPGMGHMINSPAALATEPDHSAIARACEVHPMQHVCSRHLAKVSP